MNKKTYGAKRALSNPQQLAIGSRAEEDLMWVNVKVLLKPAQAGGHPPFLPALPGSWVRGQAISHPSEDGPYQKPLRHKWFSVGGSVFKIPI